MSQEEASFRQDFFREATNRLIKFLGESCGSLTRKTRAFRVSANSTEDHARQQRIAYAILSTRQKLIALRNGGVKHRKLLTVGN
jgi:hypothetical protein